jgi:hypothetical protein
MKSFTEFLSESFNPGWVDTKLKFYTDEPFAQHPWKSTYKITAAEFKSEAGFGVDDRKSFIKLKQQLFNLKQIHIRTDSTGKNVHFFSDKFTDNETMYGAAEKYMDS